MIVGSFERRNWQLLIDTKMTKFDRIGQEIDANQNQIKYVWS